MPTVLLTDPIDTEEAARLQQHAEVRLLGEESTGLLGAEMADADVVIVRRDIPADLLTASRRLRALVRHGVGLDFIPVAAASAAGVAVTNTPGTNSVSVAEHAFGLILSLVRKISHNDHAIRRGEWHELRGEAPQSEELAGKTLGIVGFGHVGQAVGRIGHFGFGMTPLVSVRAARAVPDWCTVMPLGGILSQSDVVVLACPLTEETRGLLCAEAIVGMKPTAIVVNVARGAVVNEADLASALAEGRLAGAALDVFAEQPIAERSPLRTTPNTLMSPHVAGVTRQSMRNMSRLAVDDALKALAGERPAHLVNAEAWPHIARRWETLR